MKNFVIVLLIICAIPNISGQQDKTEREYKNSILFDNTEPIPLTIYVNKRKLFRDVEEKRKYHPANIIIGNKDSATNEYHVKLRTRGKFRRNMRYCNMPLLRIKIPKMVREHENIFKNQYVIKLVVPCKQNSEKYQEYVIQEYLIYKLYNILTDKSYRVRLVDISLKDSLKPEKNLNYKGFFIEETKQLEERLKGKILKSDNLHHENVERPHLNMLVVFQYLIGNTDWSIDAGHNIKLLFFDKEKSPYAIPYDFDWSGLVNANYAIPSKLLPISSVRERLFRGYKRPVEEYTPVINLFNEKRKQIYALYENCQWLSEKTKASTIKYIDEFYDIINDSKKVNKEFITKCRMK